MTAYTVRTLQQLGQRPEADERMTAAAWHEFMFHDSVAAAYFDYLYTDFPDYQYVLYDGDTLVASGCSIPLAWNLDDHALPDTGWDWALQSGVEGWQRGETPTTLCAIQIVVARDYQGKGVSRHAVLAMKAIAVEHGLNALIAPVRPNLKASYPLTPMERYIQWARPDGAPFDPWLRTHWRVGARIVKVAPRSMLIPGTVAQWRAWTGLEFPESGEYVIPGALNPVTADVEADRITYVEPNVWMHHPIES